ncbi:hypothetical protein [Winogradskyella jejuensis]|uniref:Uncharacterized protein n=1 Tax=Winogradskyella jejuensis TaxID=1089305 RepID=A0A1M5KG12_9FLAO|nr:hypothetical protein [Winogradskyella jejuensis]SHG51796.1 hypothetical protein SAMN05444148_0324 [Winogradskyella jejuensis]
MKTLKFKIYKTVAVLFIAALTFSCSGDDDNTEEAIIDVTNLRILAQDGFSVGVSDCIDPNENYLVEITISTQNNIQLTEPVVVNYTVNGNTSSVTFTQVGIKTIPVNFVTGENVVELVESGTSVSLTVVAPSEFVLLP